MSAVCGLPTSPRTPGRGRRLAAAPTGTPSEIVSDLSGHPRTHPVCLGDTHRNLNDAQQITRSSIHEATQLSGTCSPGGSVGRMLGHRWCNQSARYYE